MSSGLVTTAEAAARLGVKRETIYAYVSRGILHRQVAMDGRTSLFDPAELDEVRLGKRDKTDGELRTVIATSITHVSDDALTVRGHDLLGLITQGRTFTEIADLLWLSDDSEQWPNPDTAVATDLSGIDGLRTIVAHVSATDPLRHDLSPKSVRAAGRRMITNMVHGLPAATGGSDRQLVLALWRRLTKRRGNAKERATLDAALALLVDHGLAGSTFAARVAASVRADPYSVVVSGLGVVGGSLHGAASGGVHTMFADAHRKRDASVAVGEALRKHGRVPGFGHSVYRRQDPRYGALMSRVIDAWGSDPKLDLVYQVRDVVNSRSDEFPNIDFALGAFTWLAAMAPEAGETIFAISRTSGWLAHAVEEYDERPLRFRPRARYLGLRPGD